MSRWPNRTFEERFWFHVDKQGPIPEYAPNLGPCWLWTGTKTDGYGMFENATAQRVSYVLSKRIIPKGWHIDHLCRVPACVNPNHLEAVTVKENIHRSPIHNANRTHCKRGHALSGHNAMKVKGGKTCRECRNANCRERYFANRRAILDRQSKRREPLGRNRKVRNCLDCGQPISPGRHRKDEYQHASGCPRDRSKLAELFGRRP